MRQETFTLSAKELQRVAVISHCVKGDLACAGAAELLGLSPRQVKRLKSRYRQGGEAAMAHASRGRPSPRRLSEPLRQSILHFARTRYRGFNDHHLCEKLTEVQGFSLSRETLRRLLRSQGLGSGRGAASTSRLSPGASASRAPRSSSIKGRHPHRTHDPLRGVTVSCCR